MLTLLKDDEHVSKQGWLVWDIDLEDKASLDEEVKSFLESYRVGSPGTRHVDGKSVVQSRRGENPSVASPHRSGGSLGLAQRQPQAAQEQIRAARQQLSDAKTDDDKKAARAHLRKLLADIFAQDMQMREKQAAEIKSRLAKLRQQYQAREKVKDQIIDLQLKVIERDAAGLGFPGNASPSPTPPEEDETDAQPDDGDGSESN